MAAIGPGLIDLAALVGGWDPPERGRLVAAYLSGLPEGDAARLASDTLSADLSRCRLHLALQWLGWSPDWRPPPEHAHDWIGEASMLAQELGLDESAGVDRECGRLRTLAGRQPGRDPGPRAGSGHERDVDGQVASGHRGRCLRSRQLARRRSSPRPRRVGFTEMASGSRATEVLSDPSEDAVAAELNRQLERFENLIGRPPTHLDSHQHVTPRTLRAQPSRARAAARAPGALGLPRASRTAAPSSDRTPVATPLPDAITVEALWRSDRGRSRPASRSSPATRPPRHDHPSVYGEERIREVEALCDPRVRRRSTAAGSLCDPSPT